MPEPIDVLMADAILSTVSENAGPLPPHVWTALRELHRVATRNREATGGKGIRPDSEAFAEAFAEAKAIGIAAGLFLGSKTEDPPESSAIWALSGYALGVEALAVLDHHLVRMLQAGMVHEGDEP